VFTARRTAALLLILTALLYAPTLGYGFIYEDRNDLQTFARAWRDSIETWAWKPARSLTELSFALGGTSPQAAHAGNVLIHLLNGGLLYGLASACLRPWAATIALGVFLLHPVQVESVAYVSNRADLLATAAVLIGVWAVIARRWAVVALACVLAFLAKETAIIAAPLLAWFAYWRGERVPRAAVIAVIVLSVPAVTFLLLTYPLLFDLRNALTPLAQLTRLLALVAWPVGLTIDHDWNWITTIPMSLTAGLWAGVLALAWSVQSSWFALAAGWCLIVIAPRTVVSLVEGLHEHHLYLCLVPIALLIGAVFGAEREEHGVSASPA
jgi:hypothetical protein